MIERTKERFDLKPHDLAGGVAQGTGETPGWLVAHEIDPQDPHEAARDPTRMLMQTEAEGLYTCPLCRRTKDTIENPVEEAKYRKAVTLTVSGDVMTRMTKHDTNPADSPQPPAKYRKSGGS